MTQVTQFIRWSINRLINVILAWPRKSISLVRLSITWQLSQIGGCLECSFCLIVSVTTCNQGEKWELEKRVKCLLNFNFPNWIQTCNRWSSWINYHHSFWPFRQTRKVFDQKHLISKPWKKSNPSSLLKLKVRFVIDQKKRGDINLNHLRMTKK